MEKKFISVPFDFELDKLCEQNPCCDCNCIKCPLFAKYMEEW